MANNEREELRHRIAVLRISIRQASAACNYERMYDMCREHDDLFLQLWHEDRLRPAA